MLQTAVQKQGAVLEELDRLQDELVEKEREKQVRCARFARCAVVLCPAPQYSVYRDSWQ